MHDLDEDTIQELMDSFHELYESIECDLNQLPNESNPERLNSLFRAIHNIKGHAAMMQLSSLVDFTHVIEDVAECLRSGKFAPSRELCECMLLGMDRLRDLHNRDVLGQKFPNLGEKVIQEKFSALALSTPDTLNEQIQSLLATLSGGYHSPVLPPNNPEEIIIPKLPTGPERHLLDLAFFQELSFQVDTQNPFWVDRSIQLYDWAQKLNRLSGDKIDYQQLAAAIYIHDLGMSFVNKNILNKPDKLQGTEILEIRRHVAWGYDLLVRMPGWEEAALIVLSHHERIDGTGYPNQLEDTLIHPGAKILAILDAFFSMISGRADRTQRKSILRTMSEINAGRGAQFDDYWVDLFNQVIKEEVRQGKL